MNCLGAFLRKVDIVGTSPKLKVEGSYHFKTKFGGFVSIILYVLTALGLYAFGKDMFQKKQPIMINSTEYYSSPPEISFSFNQTVFMIELTDSYFNPINISLYDFSARLGVVDLKTYANGTSYYDSSKTRFLNLTNCNIDTSFGKFKDLYSEVAWQNKICLQPYEYDAFTLEGDYGQDHYKFFAIDFFKCTNKTGSTKVCKSPEEISKNLQGYIGIKVIDYIVDPTDYQNPSKYYIRQEYTTFSAAYYKEILLRFSITQVISDAGWFMEDKQTENVTMYQSWNEYTTFFSQNQFLKMFFRSAYTRNVVSRKYIKIQEIVAQVGGLVKGILVVLALLSSFVINTNYYIYLANKLFVPAADLDPLKKTEIKFNSKLFPNSHIKDFRNDDSSSKSKIDLLNNSVFVKKDPNANNIDSLNKKMSYTVALDAKTKVFNLKRKDFCLACCSGKKGNESLKFYHRVRRVVNKNTDIVFLIKKFYQFELFKKILFNKQQSVIYKYLCKSKVLAIDDDDPNGSFLDNKDVIHNAYTYLKQDDENPLNKSLLNILAENLDKKEKIINSFKDKKEIN